MTSMGLQILKAKGRADMEVRLAQALTNRGADCSQTNQTLCELVAALPAKQKGLAQAAFGFDPVSMPCHCICPSPAPSHLSCVLASIPLKPIHPATLRLTRPIAYIPHSSHLSCTLASVPHTNIYPAPSPLSRI